MKNLVKKFQNTSHQQDLWQKGSKIVLGISGGPDSVCLLDIFAKIQRNYALELIIAHVNYGLRGRDSERDEKFVRDLAEKYNLEIEILKFNNSKVEHLSSLKESSRFNLKNVSENYLRDLRYDFFEKIRQQYKFDLIAVAHNSDDQVETFLMRMLRGSGLQGLSGMKYKSGKIIRPLLSTTRQEILEYLNKTDATYRTDGTNAENLFLRNKIRNKLLPFLEKNFNPKIRQTLFSATTSIAEDSSFINDAVEKLVNMQSQLSAKKILGLHPALQRRLLLRHIEQQKFNLKDIGAAHIEEILKALKSTKGKNQIVVFKGLKMMRKGDKVTISKL